MWLGAPSLAEYGALEELGKYTEQIKNYHASVLDRAADAAKQAGVPCETIRVKDAKPYQAIIATAANGRSHRHGNARARRTIRSPARQRDKQGADAHKIPVLVCH